MKRFLVIIALLSIVGVSYAQINVRASRRGSVKGES